MKKYLLIILFIAALICACFAQEPQKVAQVADIKGALEVKKQNSDWSYASVKMPAYVQDQFKTDNSSVADLEFLIGGHVGINKNTVIEITGERDIKDLTKRTFTQKVVLKAGAIWAKFKGQDKNLQFQTRGGVLAIKGTEFVMEEKPDAKQTQVSVLEGEVLYTTAKGEISAKAGDKITIPWQDVPVVRHYKPEELKKECENNFADLYNAIKDIIGFVVMAQAISGQSIVDSGTLGYACMAAEVINNPADAVKNYAVSAASSYVPGPFGSMISGAASNKEEKKPDFPTGLSPDQIEAEGLNPSFSWSAFPGADSYLVLLSPQEDMKDLYWSQEVPSTSAQYPNWAKTLQTGTKYYWRVIAASGNKAVSKASQTFFTVK